MGEIGRSTVCVAFTISTQSALGGTMRNSQKDKFQAIRDPVIRNLFMAVILAIVGTSSQAWSADSIRQAALEAIEGNPEVQASWHAFLAAGYDHRQARGGYLPSVDLSATTGRVNRDFDGRGSFDRSQAEVSITQMLFDGFRVRHAVGQADKARLVSYYELLDTAEQTALSAFSTYQDVMRYREMVVLAQENYSNHDRVFQQIQRRAQSGLSTHADLEQIRGRLSLAESNLLTEAANLHDVTARFLRIVGRKPGSDMTPASLEGAEIPADVREALTLAYNGNPSFHAAVTGIEQAHESAQIRRSAYFPRLELRGRQGLSDNVNGFDRRFDRDDPGSEGAVELVLSYNLYRGGADRAARRAALERLNQAHDLRDQACINVRQTVQIAHNDVRNTEERLNALTQHSNSARAVVNSYHEQFDIGQRALLDVLDAENEAFQAGRALAHAQHDLEIARARALAGMGLLLSTLDIAREELPSLSDLGAEQISADPATTCGAQEAFGLSRADLVQQQITLEADATFEIGSAILTNKATSALEQLIEKLGDTTEISRIVITGHTDNTGSRALNHRLSSERANTVRDYLVTRNIDAQIISTEGRGSSFPIAKNNTPAGRASNRRVEITVIRLK